MWARAVLASYGVRPVSTLRPPYEVLTERVAALPASLASGDFRALVDQQAARLAALGAAVAAEQALGVLDLSPTLTLTPDPTATATPQPQLRPKALP